MMLTSMVLWLVIAPGAPAAAGQSRHENDRDVEEQQIRTGQRQERSDTAAIAALKERVKNNEAELTDLKKSIDGLWDEYRKTAAIASGTQAQMALLYTIGRPIGGLLLFIGGIVVTRLVTNYMNRKKARHSAAMTARRGS